MNKLWKKFKNFVFETKVGMVIVGTILFISFVSTLVIFCFIALLSTY